MEKLFVIFAIFLTVVGAVEILNYSRDDVRVVSGNHECISNCSLFSDDRNQSVSCSIGECSRNLVSSSNSLGINIMDVFFERFENEVMGLDKLALHIKWTSTDIENTKGFMLNITDGESNYIKCYDIDKVFDKNSGKAIFYNDCFGKVTNTAVKIASNIRAEISPLPLNENDLGKVILDVEVPNCSNSQLFSFEECQSSGGIPITEPCQDNCNTFSEVGNISYPILCNVSKPTFSSSSFRNLCPDTNRSVEGVSSYPKHVPNPQEWYKFIDEDTNEIKLALNFSWKHRGDSSLSSLLGYIYTIHDVSTPNVVPFTECTTIETPLVLGEHENAEYYSNCYGRIGASEVKPDGKYYVTLQSRGTSTPEHISIEIPGCASESLHDVTECETHDLRILSDAEHVYCENLTVRYSYYVSSEFGTLAEVVFCEKGEYPHICKNVIHKFEDLQPSNTLYNLSLPSNSDRTIPYVVFVRGNDPRYSNRNFSDVDFSHCVRGTPISNTAISLISIAIVLFLLMLAIGVWFFCFRDKCGFWIFKKYYPPPPEIHVSLPLPADITAPAALPEKVRAFIVFAEDHHLHTEVVHWFCSFLKIELGIDAKVHIWERAQSATNRPEYLMSNLKNADRVVVICSEGTLDSNNKQNQNMHTAAISKIISDSLMSNNPEKYLVGYFGYSSVEHVPEHLRDTAGTTSMFNLMDDFEKFYFRLVGIEQYQEGGILKINEINDYFDPEKRSEGGRKLHNAITNMSKFVHDYPSWYTDANTGDMAENGYNRIPQEPPAIDNTQLHEQGIHDQGTDELPSIRHLNAQSPQSINGAGARPKVKHTAPLQNPQPHPNPVMQYYPQTNQLPPQNLYHNGPVPAAQPNNGRVANPLQWNPGQRQPLENSSIPAREPCEHSTMPDSMESSFEIPDTVDLSSVSPSKVPTKPLDEPKSVKPIPAKPLNSLLYNPSFHPESFTSNDFVTDDFESTPDSHMMTNMPSNTTQMTNLGSLGPPEPKYKGPTSDIMTFLPSTATEMTSFGDEDPSSKLQEVDSLIDGVMVRRPSNEVSAESGLFTLAKIDEDELDLEDQIKSINLII